MFASNVTLPVTRRLNWLLIDLIVMSLCIIFSLFISTKLFNNISFDIQFFLFVFIAIFTTQIFCYMSVNALYLKNIKRPKLWKIDFLRIFKGFIFTLFLLIIYLIFSDQFKYENILITLISSLTTLILITTARALEFSMLKSQTNLALFVNPDKRWEKSLIEIRQALEKDCQMAIIQSGNKNNNKLRSDIESWDKTKLDAFFRTNITDKRKVVIIFNEIQPKTEISNDLLKSAYKSSFPIMSINDFYEEVLEKSPLLEDKNIWHYSPNIRETGFIYLAIKRILDIISASLLLLAFIPVIFILIIMIKIESKGPAFFNQNRLGLNGRSFMCYKLRTMEEHEDDVNQWPKFSSHHVTKLGKKLRNSGLDELPQLLNVIKGDMSMVGPRPLREKLAEQHLAKNPFFAITLRLKPGISGWAQVHQGKDTGYDTLVEKIRYDLFYAKNHSLNLDLLIYILTFSQLVTGKKPKTTISTALPTIE